MDVTNSGDVSSPSLGGSRLTEVVYMRLSNDIGGGKLKPGQQLLETVLAREMGVSRTPVREAIHLLISDGTAEATEGKVVVKELSLKAVRDLRLINRVLMKTACRLAALNHTEEQMSALEVLMAKMEAVTSERDLDTWKDHDREFHLQIACMADNLPLFRMVRQMGFQLTRVRHLAILQPGRLEQSMDEHRRVIEAIKKRDVELAEGAIEDHMDTGDQITFQILENFVVPFKGDRF
jgi:DNA-binding GntR family transcriptional regulator